MTALSQVGKLYSQMSPAALASLVMNAAVAGEFDEVDKILAAVPRKLYKCPDIAYSWRRDAMESGLLALGVEYWYSVSMMMVGHASILAQALDDDVELGKFTEADQIYQKWANHQQALDETLKLLCQDSGLDEVRIRSWLRIPKEMPQRDLDAAGQSTIDERLASWRKALSC